MAERVIIRREHNLHQRPGADYVTADCLEEELAPLWQAYRGLHRANIDTLVELAGTGPASLAALEADDFLARCSASGSWYSLNRLIDAFYQPEGQPSRTERCRDAGCDPNLGFAADFTLPIVGGTLLLKLTGPGWVTCDRHGPPWWQPGPVPRVLLEELPALPVVKASVPLLYQQSAA